MYAVLDHRGGGRGKGTSFKEKEAKKKGEGKWKVKTLCGRANKNRHLARPAESIKKSGGEKFAQRGQRDGDLINTRLFKAR